MSARLEIIFKILELIISISIPIIILVLGTKLSKKLEDTKRITEEQFYWESNISNYYMEKFKQYCNDVSDFVCYKQLLNIKIDDNTQNEDEEKKITLEFNLIFLQIAKDHLLLKNLFIQERDVEILMDKILDLITSSFKENGRNPTDILKELNKLINTIGKKYNKNLSNKDKISKCAHA